MSGSESYQASSTDIGAVAYSQCSPSAKVRSHQQASQLESAETCSEQSHSISNPANPTWRSFQAQEAEAFERYLYRIKNLDIPHSKSYPIMSLSKLLSVNAAHPALSPFLPKTFRGWIQFRIRRLEDKIPLLKENIAQRQAQRAADIRNTALGLNAAIGKCLGGKAGSLANLLQWATHEPSIKQVEEANHEMDADVWFRCRAEFLIGEALLKEME